MVGYVHRMGQLAPQPQNRLSPKVTFLKHQSWMQVISAEASQLAQGISNNLQFRRGRVAVALGSYGAEQPFQKVDLGTSNLPVGSHLNVFDQELYHLKFLFAREAGPRDDLCLDSVTSSHQLIPAFILDP